MKPLMRALLIAGAIAAPLISTGCRQKMADQPYFRPLEETDFFSDHRASRPLEHGTIHRGQHLEFDPLVTGLTREEWERAYEYAVPANPDTVWTTDAEKIKRAVGAPRYDQRVAGQPKVYVEEFPFAITGKGLERGQERYTIYCAVCHGPRGNGQGKIWERGYLQPTSFHTTKVDASEAEDKAPPGHGISRGYALWLREPDHPRMPMDQVPVGYIFEVMTKGYGGMPSYSAQIPPDDRWLIVAYIRALQMTQRIDDAKQKLLAEAGGKK
jgi:mono/diheme cytochrome c family protein